MRGLIALVRACHAGPTLAVTLVSALLAVAVGHDAPMAVLLTFAVLAGQLSIGWSNDWLDAARDVASARTDKPVVRAELRPATLRACALAAAAACVILSLATSVAAGVLHLIAVLAGWGYNLGLKATVASVVPYAVAFGLLPAFLVAALPGHPGAPPWLIAAGALLGAGAHFANVLPDLEDDVATGVLGLGQRLGRGVCGALAAALLLAAVVTLALGPPGPPTTTGLAGIALAIALGGGGLVFGRRPGSRAPFTSVLLLAVAAVGLFVASGASLR